MSNETKISIPLQLSILCSFLISVVSSFGLGIRYGVKPYAELLATTRNPSDLIAIVTGHNQTLVFVSALSFLFSLLSLIFLIIYYRKKSQELDQAGPSTQAATP